MEEDHHHFMGLAIEEAARAYDLGEVPVGAVLVGPSGEVLARGYNSPIRSADPTAHAEVLVLRQAARDAGNYRLPGTVLYVTLEPCAMCVGAMLHARIETLIFGASDPKTGSAGSVVDLTSVSAFNHTIKIVGGVRADECADLLRRFFRERRREGKPGDGGEVPKRP